MFVSVEKLLQMKKGGSYHLSPLLVRRKPTTPVLKPEGRDFYGCRKLMRHLERNTAVS